MKLSWGFAVLLVSMLAGGCGTVGNFLAGKDNSAPPAELVTLTPSLTVQTLWSKDVGSGSDNQYIKLAPVVEGDKVFAADRKGRVSAYGTVNGQLLWETQTKSPISGGPGSGEGLVLVGTSEGEVIALNAGTGEIAWRAQVSSEILAAPRATQGVVVARTVDGKLFGLDAKQGTRIWVYEQSVPALTLRGTSAPLLVGDKVIAGFASSKLVAITLNEGKLLWEASVAEPRGRSELERLVDISGELQVADGIIYVASFQGRVAAVDLESGRALWARNMSSNAGISVGEGSLYVTDDQSHVWALDRRDGGTLWKQDKLQARSVTAPAVYGDYVAVGDFEGYLHWMSHEDGSFVAREKIDDDGIIAPPVVASDTLYVSGKGGVLAALRTGK
jgi:outer membrane protein assembly factor BamB